MITREELLLQFIYCKDSGNFTRVAERDCHGNLKTCNYLVKGTNGHRGYKRVSINGERFLLHKLAILYVTGLYPEDEVDHINGDTGDNRFSNLRNCGKRKNRLNLKRYSTNTSGFTGVHLKDGKYYAQARIDGVNYFRGYFLSIEEAVSAREELNKLLGFSEEHGRVNED